MEQQFHDKLKINVEKYLNQKDYEKALKLAEEIGAMLWSTIQKL